MRHESAVMLTGYRPAYNPMAGQMGGRMLTVSEDSRGPPPPQIQPQPAGSVCQTHRHTHTDRHTVWFCLIL